MDLGGAVVVYVVKIHRIFGHDKLSEARIDADGLPLFVGPVVGRVARDQHAHAARLQHGAGTHIAGHVVPDAAPVAKGAVAHV